MSGFFLKKKLYRWSSFNYNFFYNDLDYLYLGSKQLKRLPATDIYGHMYSHFRNEYSVFFYKRMWLNYIKKINLLKKLYSDSANNFFFITNKIEQVKFLSGQANRAQAQVIFIEAAGQFSDKLYNKDSKYFFPKVQSLGANNAGIGYSYGDRESNVFFTLSNGPQDRNYFKFLTEISYNDFLVISTADSDSIFLSKFIPLFGNNDNAKAWFFFFNLFKKSAVRFNALDPRRWTNISRGAAVDIIYKTNFFMSFTPNATSHSFYRSSNRVATRSLRAFCIVNLKKALSDNSYEFGAGKFSLPKKQFHYFKYRHF